MFLQWKDKLRWWTSHQLERRRSVWRRREVSCHRRRQCSFQKTSRSRRRSGSSPWPARSTNTRSSFWKVQEYFDLNNLQPVVLLHQLHGPWPRDLHTFKVNIIINSLVFEDHSRPVWACWARQAPPARSAPSWSCSLLAGRTRPGCKP